MKPFALAFAALTILATSAFAYVQSGHLPQPPPPTTTTRQYAPNGDLETTPLRDPADSDLGRGINRRAPETTPGDRPTNPVPEPGTMILTSMGLIALGAAVRRRRR
jgi:hypothetical protein